MELVTLETVEEPLYSRTHLVLEARFEASVPPRGVVAQRICEEHDVPMDRVIIRSITSRFGGGLATVDAYIYTDAARLRELEPEHLVERTKKTAPAAQQTVEEAVEETVAADATPLPEEDEDDTEKQE